MGKLESELKGYFGEENVARKVLADATVSFKITEAELPQGCQPQRLAVLVTFPGGNDPPQVFIKEQVKLANGNVPRSLTNVTFDGEAWVGFSANFAWDPSRPLWYFVAGKLRRFAQPD